MVRINQVQLKATFDQTLTDSDNIEGFAPTGTPKPSSTSVGDLYCYVSNVPDYSQGEERFSPAISSSYAGVEIVTYNQPEMHPETLTWLRATYEGSVTVYLSKDGKTYARYNAFLKFPPQPRINAIGYYNDVTWQFRLVEAL